MAIQEQGLTTQQKEAARKYSDMIIKEFFKGFDDLLLSVGLQRIAEPPYCRPQRKPETETSRIHLV